MSRKILKVKAIHQLKKKERKKSIKKRRKGKEKEKKKGKRIREDISLNIDQKGLLFKRKLKNIDCIHKKSIENQFVIKIFK